MKQSASPLISAERWWLRNSAGAHRLHEGTEQVIVQRRPYHLVGHAAASTAATLPEQSTRRAATVRRRSVLWQISRILQVKSNLSGNCLLAEWM